MGGKKGIAQFSLFLVFVWFCTNAVRPYWDRYWLEMYMGTAAVYGTKNSVSDTRAFLEKEMLEKGFGFEGGDFAIEKDLDNSVTISLSYIDEIRFLGVKWKELELMAEASAQDVRKF